MTRTLVLGGRAITPRDESRGLDAGLGSENTNNHSAALWGVRTVRCLLDR